MALPEGFSYRPGFFDPATAAEHLAGLLTEVAWERQEFTIYGRRVPMPRLIAMYGPVGYRYSGVEHPRRPLPERLAAICDRVETGTGLRFNSVLLNLYRDGRDSVSWHRDNDYLNGGHADIASVSLGATRRFQVRDADGQHAEIALEAGSLLLVSGAALARWWHCVPKTARRVGPRVNLTLRYMVDLPMFSGATTKAVQGRERDQTTSANTLPRSSDLLGSGYALHERKQAKARE